MRHRAPSAAILVSILVGLAMPHLASVQAVAAAPGNPITQVGVDVNYQAPKSFIDALSLQGLDWIRQYGPNGDTPLIHSAGINDLMVLNENLFSYNPATFGWQIPLYTNVQQLPPALWAVYVTAAAKAMPWITEWEFLNEPNLAGGGSEPVAWTPQQYFTYLVATYQALKAVNPNNELIGPTVAWPWPLDPYDVTNGIVNWLKALWALTDPTTGLTAAKMLSAVSMHIYTNGWGGGKMIGDPYAAGVTETIGQVIQAGLAQCYAVTGKPMVIDEWGWPSASMTSGGATVTSSPAVQATYFQQFMGLMESTPDIAGVFAYNWSDYGQPAGWAGMGVFDSNLKPQPAWSVYQQYFSSPSSSMTLEASFINGTSINGIYVEARSNGALVAAGTTPLTFYGKVGTPYAVSFYYMPPYNYGVVYFDHLSTGNATSTAIVVLTGPTTVVAFYRTS